jgi:predicted nucleic acid-binding protein
LLILNFTSDAAVKFGEVRSILVSEGNDIGFADTAISSIALTNDCYVLTRNVNHFFRIDDLKVME